MHIVIINSAERLILCVMLHLLIKYNRHFIFLCYNHTIKTTVNPYILNKISKEVKYEKKYFVYDTSVNYVSPGYYQYLYYGMEIT